MRPKTILVIICIVMILFAAFAFKSSITEEDYARITDMHYIAKVVDAPNSSGKIVVTETITFDVHAAHKWNGFWELWRDLCESYIDGLKVYYKVNSVKQLLPDGREIVWKQSPKLYWDDSDYVESNKTYGPGKWFHSPGPYNESARMYECLLFYVNNLYREQITFEIEYEMYNAVFHYGDSSDLYISMYSGDTIEYLNSFSGEILIPNKDMPKEGNYSFTTYGTKGGDFPIKESKDIHPGYHTFYFDLDKKDLKFDINNQFIEFDLVSYGDDKHIFSEYASVNNYYNDDVLDEIFAEQTKYKVSQTIFVILKFVLLGVCIFLSMAIINKARKKIKELDKKHNIKEEEIENYMFRDIPSDLDPNFAASLVFSKDIKFPKEENVYSSILLSLVRKKYIEIKEINKRDVLITVLEVELPELEPIAKFEDGNFNWYKPKAEDPREPLTLSEDYYLKLINRHSKKKPILMSELQEKISVDFNYTKNFSENIKKAVKTIGINLGYFKSSGYLSVQNDLQSDAITSLILGLAAVIGCFLFSKTALALTLGGFFILGLAYLYSAYYVFKNSFKYVAFTELGESEYVKWKGLYNFLKSDTLMKERTAVELPLWEKYLVYATAFGISEKVTAALQIYCKELPTVNVGTTQSMIYNSYYSSGRYRSYASHFHSSVYHGSSTISSISSGGYGSFHYGGGGRGGGGGGGGH